MESLANIFGANLVRCRIQLKETQGAVAARARISQQYLSDLERGTRTNLSITKLVQLATALETTTIDLLRSVSTSSLGPPHV